MPGVSPLLALGLLLIAGLLAGLAAQRLGLPRVAAYVLAGVAFCPDLLGRVLASTPPHGPRR